MSLRNEERDSYAGMCLAAPNAFVAAELVFGGTYRLATPEEIAVEEERQRVERERILAQDAASRSQGTTVQVPADALRESIAKLGIQLAKSTGK